MGIQDRDYMRERARARAGQSSYRPTGTTSGKQKYLPLILFATITLLVAAENRGVLPNPLASRPIVPAGGSSNPLSASASSFPTSGKEVWWVKFSPSVARGELQVFDRTGNGQDKVFRFRAIENPDQPIAELYVAAGRTQKINLPLGRYLVTMAQGSSWYGPEDYFGATGSYWNMSTSDIQLPLGRGSQSKTILPFAISTGPTDQSISARSF